MKIISKIKSILGDSDIRKARPNLSVAAPLTFWLCIGYSGLNLALGYIIYSVKDVSDLEIYKLISQTSVGLIFAAISFTLLFSLIINAWSLTRILLGIGLFIKSFYAYSLVVLGTQIGFQAINGILVIWLFITYVQFCMIVFFAPPYLNGGYKK